MTSFVVRPARSTSTLALAIFQIVVGFVGVGYEVFQLGSAWPQMHALSSPQFAAGHRDLVALSEIHYLPALLGASSVGLALSLALVVDGVGLLRAKGWAYKLGVLYGWLSIAYQAAWMVYLIIAVTPVRMAGHANAAVPPELAGKMYPEAYRHGMLLTDMLGTVATGLGLLCPIFVLIMLAVTREAFRRPRPERVARLVEVGVVLAAAVVAVASARPFACSVNDKSRLSTVVCLVDYHTLAIDRSPWFNETCDKFRPRPDGPFYSHQPPVLALMLAAPYQALQSAFGLRAADHPVIFSYLMTLLFCGLPYVTAAWGLYRLGLALGLAPGWAAVLTASFALATVAPVYACQVNSGPPLLAAAASVFLNLTVLGRPGDRVVGRLLLVGALAGFAYAVEQPTGSLLLVAAAVVAAVRVRRPSAAVWVVLAAVPWAVLHHAVAYSYTGTLGQAAADPAFWDYPGSIFNASNLTGRWNHADLNAFGAYAFLMLFGLRGFALSNPTLLLALPAGAWALWRAAGRAEAVCLGLWVLGVWLVYAALSNNYGGTCCTIRWFVPLLVPAYYWLALLLRDVSQFRLDFIVLSVWGAVLAVPFWIGGPFGRFYEATVCPFFPCFFWAVLAVGLIAWSACRGFAAIGAAPLR